MGPRTCVDRRGGQDRRSQIHTPVRYAECMWTVTISTTCVLKTALIHIKLTWFANAASIMSFTFHAQHVHVYLAIPAQRSVAVPRRKCLAHRIRSWIVNCSHQPLPPLQQLTGSAAALSILCSLTLPVQPAYAQDFVQPNKPSIEVTKAAIQHDFVDGQYYVTGKLTAGLYEPNCLFVDPTTRVTGDALPALEKHIVVVFSIPRIMMQCNTALSSPNIVIAAIEKCYLWATSK